MVEVLGLECSRGRHSELYVVVISRLSENIEKNPRKNTINTKINIIIIPCSFSWFLLLVNYKI